MKRTAPRLNAPMVEWALWWASRGWLVFPVWQPIDGLHCACGQTHKDSGKHPVIREGFKAGSADPDVIRARWAEHPNANIGSTLPAGWVALDIDGELDEGVSFPETETHDTGKGQHLIYVNNLSNPLDQTQTSGRYWTNVDTRVSGKGYIVLPPSLHQSGTRYKLSNDMQPIEFPDSLVPNLKKTRERKTNPGDTEVVRLLTMPRDADELGDDAMAKVAGYLARYIPDKEHFDALLWAINAGLAEPMHPTALAKKRGIFDKHQETLAAKESKATDDEGRGWLFELGDSGYSTPIETRDNVDYVAWSDFRVSARGLIILPDQQVWIVDFHKADGTTLIGERLSSKVLAFPSRLRSWLLDRGMILHDNRQDKRTAHGTRLVKLMQSQDPPVWKSRDYYGWCEESGAFLTPAGEVHPEEGLRLFSGVYPDDELAHSSPTAYRWEADITQARDWFKRLMALQDETETAKIGAWLMMLLLRGQWRGILPGILVEASAGVGKTLFFQLLSQLAGSTNDGEAMTLASARDMLAGNSSGFVWLDDVATTVQMEELVRKAVTQGKVTLKSKDDLGNWRTTYKKLRGSIVISGEGTDFYRQKAQRDRFIDVEFTNKNRSPDAVKLQGEDIGKGSGALLQEALKHAGLLSQMAELMEGVTDRDRQAQTSLRVGARILDAVMDSGTHYSSLIDTWFMGKAVELDKGQASEVVLHVLPTLWSFLGMPKSAGENGMALPVWFDEADSCFYVSAITVAEYWNNRKNVNERQRQLTSQANINRELDACGASDAVTKRYSKESKGTKKYRKLNKKYSNLILQAAEVHTED
jgi:hypothetical protein